MGMERFVTAKEMPILIDFTIEQPTNYPKKEVPEVKEKKEFHSLEKVALPSSPKQEPSSPPKQEPEIDETKETPIISDVSEDAAPIPAKIQDMEVSPKEEVSESSGNDIENNSGEGQIAEGYVAANLSYIKGLIAKHLRYPQIARELGLTGTVIVSFIIIPNGYIEEIKIKQSSGFGVLDKNAVEAIKKISPLSQPPPIKVKVIIPISYNLG